MKNSSVIVSIIIPAYNVEKYIEECVSSLTSQTLDSIELICVDDGSTDSTPQLLDELAQQDTRIKVIHRNNGGLSAARNSGMAIATGKYIGFVDGDDWVDKNMYKGLSDALERNEKSEIAVCGVETIFKYNESRNIIRGYDNYFRISQFGEFPVNKDTFHINKPCWNKLYRREFLCSNGIKFPEGMNNEDEVFHNFVLSRATHITYVKGNWYKYMRYGTGIIADQRKAFTDKQELPDYFTKVWPLLIEYIKRDARYDLLPDMVDILLGKSIEYKGDFTDNFVSTLLHRLDFPSVADYIDLSPDNDNRKMLQALYELNGKEEIQEPNLSLLPLPLPQTEYCEKPIFSFVVPIYNSSKYLHWCMETLRKQTLSEIEIICVNDGSTDNSAEILDNYVLLDKRIHVITQENKGAFIARKVGGLEAKGKYLIFVDPDDWIDTNTCMHINNILQNCDVDMLQYAIHIEPHSAHCSKEYVDGLQDFFNRVPHIKEESNEEYLRACFQEEGLFWNNCGKAIRNDVAKKAFMEMPNMRCNFAEDQIAMFYILSFTKSFINIKERLYHYRIGTGISTKSKESINDFVVKLTCFDLFNSLTQFVKKHYKQKSQAVEKALQFINNSMMDNMWRRLIENAKQDELNDWIMQWCEKAGTDKVIAYLITMITLPEQTLDNCQQTKTDTSVGIESFRKSQGKLQQKYYKHLRAIRLLIAISIILLLTNIISLIIILTL